MPVTHRPERAAQENGDPKRTRPPVDELIRNRHETALPAGVESPSRAAGGFPTQGGGVAADSQADTDRSVREAPPDDAAAGGEAA